MERDPEHAPGHPAPRELPARTVQGPGLEPGPGIGRYLNPRQRHLHTEALPLMATLSDRGITVLVETSGLVSVEGVDPRVHIIMDLKCPDSGECENNLWSNLDLLKPSDQVKFVIASRRDFDWTAEVIRHHSLDRRFLVLLSAVFDRVLPIDLVGWLLESQLYVRLQLQLHKYIWRPDAR